MLSIHNSIHNKLNDFIKIQKIPNILFYGPHGSGKKEILFSFLKNIYGGSLNNKKYILIENCGHNTGIKFIRDEFKFFCKSNINHCGGNVFKTVVLLNADKLTSDAQSALRRCIEIYNHNTRFFIVTEDKNKILKPILSRFCDFYIPLPVIKNKKTNLHNYKNENIFKNQNNNKKITWLKKHIQQNKSLDYYSNLSETIYNKGYHILDLFDYCESLDFIEETYKYKILMYFDKIRKEFRNEKLIMTLFFYFLFLRPNCDLENVTIM